MKYKTEAYLLTCLTNLHAGSGENDMGVVDNQVQRDPVTGIPVIHSSSLKGALREYFSSNTAIDKSVVEYVFGADQQRDKNSTEKIGHYKFFQADMIVYPVRSNKQVFRRATSLEQLGEVINRASQLGADTVNEEAFGLTEEAKNLAIKSNEPRIKSGNELLENLTATGGLEIDEQSLLGNYPALYEKSDYRNLVKRLPTIARNQLENGESNNLWYEEIVPRESKFIFLVARPKECLSDPQFNDFENELADCTVQIGANGSIGYGYCSIKKITP